MSAHPSKLTKEEALDLADHFKTRFQLQISRDILATIIDDVAAHSYNDGWDDCIEAMNNMDRNTSNA